MMGSGVSIVWDLWGSPVRGTGSAWYLGGALCVVLMHDGIWGERCVGSVG